MVTAQEAARQYRRLGWPTVPLNPNTKVLAVQGFTGRHESEMTDADWTAYADAPNHPPGRGGWNIAIRLPDGVIALDVDSYHDGDETMARLVTELGGLPVTPASGNSGSAGGHLFYRVPPGTRLANSAGPGVDVLQHHHRYSVVWPSVVDDTEAAGALGRRREYGWKLSPPLDSYALDAVAELPAKWLEYLQQGASAERAHSTPEAVHAFLAAVEARDGDSPACDEMDRALTDFTEALAAGGSRYDAMVAATLRVACLSAEGHRGLWPALAEVETEYQSAVAGEARDTAAEYARASDGALEIAAGRALVAVDPCTVIVGAPEVPGGAEPELEFLPLPGSTWTDRHVAASALVFAGRWMRSTDTGAWLAYAGDRWRWHYCVGSEGAEGAVSTAVAFIRPGDPESVDPLEGARASLYKRMTGTGSAGVYTQAKRLYRSEAMPIPHLRAEELDADPEHLWAGGQCWDLRASADRPVLADGVDPGSVHVHSAGPVAPEPRETPLWDAFLAAVWPDPEFRAWALRVLGITVTGYADRALPILYGPPGTGKTSVASLLGHALGTYYVAADPRLLSARDVHASVVLALKGARVAFIDEAPRDTFSVTERLKMLTGGGQLTGNRMRGNPETFWPTHSLILTSNDEPRVSDPAVRSRVRPLACLGDGAAVTEARRSMHGAEWAAELPGVLASLMAEAGRWLADPASGGNREAELEALERLGLESDPVALWVTEETEPTGWTTSGDLWSAYATWCAVNGVGARDGMGNAITFGRRLSQLVGEENKRKYQGDRQYRLTVLGRTDRETIRPHVPAGPSDPVSGPYGPGADTPSGSDAGVGSPNHVTPTENPTSPGETPTQGHMGQIESVLSREQQSSYIERGEGPSDPETPSRSHLSAPPDPEPETASPEVESAPPAAEYEAVALPALVQRDGLQTTSLSMVDAEAVASLWWGKDVTLDVEHTGYPVGHKDYRLKTVQLGDEHLVLVLDAADPAQVGLATWALDGASSVTAHSSQADLIPLAEAGQVDPAAWWAKVVDTAVVAALENPEDVSKGLGIRPDYSLKGLSAYVIPRRLGVDPVAPGADKARAALFRKGKWLTNVAPTTPLKRSGWAQVPVDHPDMVRYAAADVLDTAALRKALAEPAPELVARERAVLSVVAKVTEVGVLLDGDYVLGKLAETEGAQAGVAERLAGLGLADPSSNAKVAEVLQAQGYELPTTDKGNVSVAADVLEKLPKTELVDSLLEWRDLEKVLGTYLRPYAAQVQHGDSRLRPTFQTLGAATTGRMSCVRPNLQQVPREGGIRGCIVADPGMSIVSADFSSVEVRIWAALSQDQALAQMLRDGLDIHKLVAQTVWGPEATKADRYQAKRGVFAWLYGGGLGTIADQLDGNPETARQVISALTRLSPTGVRWSDAIRDQVKNRRMPYWRHPSGRLTHLPHRLPHKAVNLCIQSTARELLVDALLKWEAGRWGGSVVLPIHDEVVALVPADQAEEATAYLVECMTSELMGVPIVAEASTPSQRWQDAV